MYTCYLVITYDAKCQMYASASLWLFLFWVFLLTNVQRVQFLLSIFPLLLLFCSLFFEQLNCPQYH